MTRTDYAEDRTVLANERTFAGWMRTSMAAVAVALGIPALIGEFEPSWLLQSAGTILIGCAIGIVLLGWRRSANVFSRLNAHTLEDTPRTPTGVIAVTIVFVYIILTVVLWLAF